MADERDEILAQYAGDGPTTADILANMPAPRWGGLKSYMPQQPPWMKAAQQYLGAGMAAIPESAAIASNFLTPSVRVPIRAYHGTAHPGGFDRFKRKRNDVGVHFGTAEQANDRLSYVTGLDPKRTADNAHVIPVDLDIQRPLRLSDIGHWDAQNLAWGLKKRHDEHRISPESVDAAMRSSRSPIAQLTALRELIHARGYDGIVYKNTGETAGAEAFRKARDAAWLAVEEANKRGELPKNGFTYENQQHPVYRAYREAENAYAAFREKNAQDSYIATRPGTVRNALTGKVMYAAPAAALTTSEILRQYYGDE
jgi:hypothetical protein